MNNLQDLVIIGNGFDLSCQLKSKYSDFFEEKYSDFQIENFSKKLKNLSELNVQIKKLQGQINAHENDRQTFIQSIKHQNTMMFSARHNLTYEERIAELNKEIKFINGDFEKNKLDRIEMINDIMQYKEFSIWDYFFMNRSKFEDNVIILWSDVEKEIYNILTNIDDDGIKLLLSSYINSSKFENKDEYISIGNFLLQYDYEDIYEFLLKELNDFENSFKIYLMEQTEKKQPYENRGHELFKKIVKGSVNDFYVINFNYTRPFTNIEKRKITHMNNVHGDIYSDEIIFGIDGFNELPVELNFFTKTSRIMSLKKTEPTSIPLSEDIESIYFFGHSFSEADYSYFLSIFDYYDIYSSNVKLCFVFVDHHPNAKKNFLKSVYSLMAKYGESFDNRAKGKNLMHKLNLENRIIITEIEN